MLLVGSLEAAAHDGVAGMSCTPDPGSRSGARMQQRVHLVSVCLMTGTEHLMDMHAVHYGEVVGDGLATDCNLTAAHMLVGEPIV